MERFVLLSLFPRHYLGALHFRGKKYEVKGLRWGRMAGELKIEQNVLICLVQLYCLWKVLAFSPAVLEENKPFHPRASVNHVGGLKK